MTEPRLIKKYANRRLYDTETSSHITLEGLRDLIAAGHEIRVIDDTSGEDISRSVLLQIIAEREQGDSPILDAEFLARIIRLYGNPMQGMMSQFLNQSFDAFAEQQAHYQEEMRKAMAATPLKALQDLTAENLKAWQDMQDAFFGKKNKDDKTE